MLPGKLKTVNEAIKKSDRRLRPALYTIVACIVIVALGAIFKMSLSDMVIAVLGVLFLAMISGIVAASISKFPVSLQVVVQISFVGIILFCLVLFGWFGWIKLQKFQKDQLGAPPQPAAAVDKIIVRPQIGRKYFENITKSFDQSEKGIRQSTERLIIKAALVAISSKDDDWQSIVLTNQDFVHELTSGGTYSLDIGSIAQHGPDYDRVETPLASYFGWVERLNDAHRLELVTLQCKADPSRQSFHVQFTLPELQNGDRLVICVQRRPGAKPATFNQDDTFALNKT